MKAQRRGIFQVQWHIYLLHWHYTTSWMSSPSSSSLSSSFRLSIYTSSLGMDLPLCHLIFNSSKVYLHNGSFQKQSSQNMKHITHFHPGQILRLHRWSLPLYPIPLNGVIIRQNRTPLWDLRFSWWWLLWLLLSVNVTSWSLVQGNQYFWETCCLHLQGTWRGQQILLKCLYTSTRSYIVTSQKVVIFKMSFLYSMY